MKSDILHSVAVCLAAVVLPLMAACVNGEASLPDEDGEAMLCLNIEQLEQTRTDLTALADNEKMHTVRIVILHPDGKVEHNVHYELGGAMSRKYVILKVKSNEKKKIFLFANEESVSAVEGVTTAGGNLSLTDFLNSYTEGTGGFETEVNKLYFAPTYTAADGSFKPIPMSSMYEISVPEKENFNGTFYVVRVATKFVVKFINWRATQVNVKYVGLENHATRNFLMARVPNSTQNQNLFKNYGGTWIDWLRYVSDNSTEYSKGGDSEQWLYDYALPEGEGSATTYTSSSFYVPPAANGAYGGYEHVFYLPESKNLADKTVTDGKQEYAMTLYIDELDAGEFKCPLTGLNALFRNMEVVVSVELLPHSIKVDIDVIPYSSVKLDPVFGL